MSSYGLSLFTWYMLVHRQSELLGSYPKRMQCTIENFFGKKFFECVGEMTNPSYLVMAGRNDDTCGAASLPGCTRKIKKEILVWFWLVATFNDANIFCVALQFVTPVLVTWGAPDLSKREGNNWSELPFAPFCLDIVWSSGSGHPALGADF